MQIGHEPDNPLTHDEYEVGDIVLYRDVNGNERFIRVMDKQTDIKDGQQGLNGKLVHADPQLPGLHPGKLVWATNEQLVEVVEESRFPTDRVYHIGHQ